MQIRLLETQMLNGIRREGYVVVIVCTAGSHKAGTIYNGDYVDHGMCKMKLNEDIIESVCAKNYENWLAVDKVFAEISRLTFWPTLYMTLYKKNKRENKMRIKI